MRLVGGRLESRYRYSKDVVYNNFVFPNIRAAEETALEQLGKAVLDARARYPAESMANLYDRIAMPAELRKAHTAIDLYVEQLYGVQPLASWEDRVKHLPDLHKSSEL